MNVYRVYKKGSRAPRNYMGRVPANSESEAVAVWIKMARSKLAPEALEAVPAHVARKIGK